MTAELFRAVGIENVSSLGMQKQKKHFWQINKQ